MKKPIQRKGAKAQIDSLRKQNGDLRIALAESVKLQAHYAKLLNMWDGGKRMVFKDAGDWMLRLRVTGKIPGKVKNAGLPG